MHKTAPNVAVAEESVSFGKMVCLPAGSFLMGDVEGDGYPQERPAHEVHVDAFWTASHCVTAREYFEFILAAGDDFQELWCDFINPCFIRKHGGTYRVVEGGDHYPMVQVSFVGAVAYCNWLSRQLGLDPVYDLATLASDLSCNGVRLLTEAEWEYACGGPERYKHGYGRQFRADLINHRSYCGEAAHLCASVGYIGAFGLQQYAPLPVGSLPPNAFGLYEMLGNVNEWCHDVYRPYSPCSLANDEDAVKGSFRAIRGGSFMDEADKLRKSYRHALHYQSKCMIDGFRIARNT
jgi:formylglycine-generating enzyme required for sulfatase activity